jgi:hypothetical protein
VWDPADDEDGITPYISKNIERDILRERKGKKRPQSARVAASPAVAGLTPTPPARPQTARLTRSEALARYASPSLASMFGMGHLSEHHAAALSPARRPSSARTVRASSARVAETSPGTPLLARRPQSARPRAGGAQPGAAVMSPPWAQDAPVLQHGQSSPIKHEEKGMPPINSKLKIIGHTPPTPESKPKKAPHKKSAPKVLNSQWAPAMALGSVEGAMKPRSRFNKDGVVYLEGISHADWSSRRKKRVASAVVSRMPSASTIQTSESEADIHLDRMMVCLFLL